MFRHREATVLGRGLPATLLALFAADRALKLAAVTHFMRRPQVAVQGPWPSLTLVQPITRASHDFTPILTARRLFEYPGTVQHLPVCDRADLASQARCRALLGDDVEIVLVDPDGGTIATKVAKVRAALPHIAGEVVCFVDDDVTLPPDALLTLVAPLLRREVGATFGVARYTAWDTIPSSLMSLFVNANALLSYLPLTYLTEPFTVTGHCFALRHTTLTTINGFGDEPNRIDDDHELARRVRAHGLRIVQTPLLYDVTNLLDSFSAYRVQMRRWFIFPRQAMLPYLDSRERALLSLGSVSGIVPALLLLLALLFRRRGALGAYLLTLVLATLVQLRLERAYLGSITPPRRWLLFPLVVTITPAHILALLAAHPIVEWRGQRLYIHDGGTFTVLGPARNR
ncbi:MAG TPA: glycosyltransferase [Thermomicrobiales bacterium]|jgi:ceramide glucosyltransferase